MNTIFKILLLSILIYSYIKKPEILKITSILIIIYTIIEYITFLKFSKNSLKSKFLKSNFIETGNPITFFNLSVKTKKVENFIKNYNEKNPTKKISLEIFGLRAMGNSLNLDKSYGNLSFGNFTNLNKVKITMVKKYDKKEIFHTIENCNNKKISEICSEIKISKKKKFSEFKNLEKFSKKFSKFLPGFLIKFYIDFINFFIYSLNINFFSYKKRNYGKGFFFPNSKKICLQNLYLPLSSKFNSCVAVFMKDIRVLPCILENGEIGYERILDFQMTGDHKHADGSNLASLIPNFKKVFQNPELFV